MRDKRALKKTLVSLIFLVALVFSAFPAVPAARAEDASAKAVLQNFPVFAQQHSLSCEYSSTRMITAFWNSEISEADFIRAISVNPNPHLGYRGNIDGWFGGTGDYGIYAEPIARVLNAHSFNTKLLAGGADQLKQELNLGHPVQVWVVAGMGWGSPFTANQDGLPFTLVAGEHSVVIYGYDANGVYVADPAYGGRAYYGWGTFLRSWSYFNYMAMSVWPASSNSGTSTLPGISPYFYRHWLNMGGVAIFGYPLGEAKPENGKIVQYFERARLEWNPNGPDNQPVSAGLLGRELTAGRGHEGSFQGVDAPADKSLMYFTETRHTLAPEFQVFWQKNGGVEIFGFPISEKFDEGGKVVQYFERGRFEYYPNNPEPYRVLLGLLGAERLKRG